MFTIHLHKLLFVGFHGVYAAEQVLGNEFEVSADIEVDAPGKINKLAHTVDYVAVYNCIKKRMLLPTPLLETLAQDLVAEIHSIDNRIRLVSVTIYKISLPIEGFQGRIGVSYKTSI